MRSTIEIRPSAADDIRYFKAREQRIIAAAIRDYLAENADVESSRRREMRANPLAPWELRVGSFRVFYDLPGSGVVRILAVGYKEHNELFVRGRRVEL